MTGRRLVPVCFLMASSVPEIGFSAASASSASLPTGLEATDKGSPHCRPIGSANGQRVRPEMISGWHAMVDRRGANAELISRPHNTKQFWMSAA